MYNTMMLCNALGNHLGYLHNIPGTIDVFAACF